MHSIAGQSEFIEIQKFIEGRCGIALGQEMSFFLEAKVNALLLENPNVVLAELYYNICILQDINLIGQLIESLTINETFWFRDKFPWMLFDEILMPSYVAALRSKEQQRIRIWSAASSTGQEPYSIAMCISSYLKRNAIIDITPHDFEIVASDIDQSVLRYAEKGEYDSIAMSRGLVESQKDIFFTKENRIWRIKDDVRTMVRFQSFNLIKDEYSYGQYDVIFCRNVLIYFSEKTKKSVYHQLSHALKQNGVLFIGSSELFDNEERRFKRILFGEGVYYQKNDLIL